MALERRLHLGAGNKPSVDVAGEHTGRLVLLARMEDAPPALTLSGFNATLNVIKALQCQNLTFGDSEEITHSPELTASTIARLFLRLA